MIVLAVIGIMAREMIEYLIFEISLFKKVISNLISC